MKNARQVEDKPSVLSRVNSNLKLAGSVRHAT